MTASSYNSVPVCKNRTSSTADQAQLVRVFVDDVEADGGDGADQAALFAVVVVVHGHQMALVVERPVKDDRLGSVAVLAEILLQRPLRSGSAVLARLLDIGLPLLAECEAALPLFDDLFLLFLDYSVVEQSGEKFKLLLNTLVVQLNGFIDASYTTFDKLA